MDLIKGLFGRIKTLEANQKETDKEILENKSGALKKINKKNLVFEDIDSNDEFVGIFEGVDSDGETSGRRYPVTSAQTCFEGKLSEDFESWLFSLEINLRNANIPKREKVFYAGAYCRNNAQQVYKQILLRNSKISWEDFKKEFRSYTFLFESVY